MVARELARYRLQQHRLMQPLLPTPEAVVTWLGAVQAQDYGGGQWALGLRMAQVTVDAIEQAFTHGTILRTHVLRPTWHFVTPADIRWLLALTAPRVRQRLATNDRHVEIDAALISRSTTVIASALEGGHHRTRTDVGLSPAGSASATS